MNNYVSVLIVLLSKILISYPSPLGYKEGHFYEHIAETRDFFMAHPFVFLVFSAHTGNLLFTQVSGATYYVNIQP